MRSGLGFQVRWWRAALAGWLAVCVSAGTPAHAQKFDTTAPHALLMDVQSGAVLYEKAADELFSPASMAKVMTVVLVFDAIRQGRLKLDDEFTVSEHAWRKGGAPSRGSAMFAALGSRVKISDLLAGAIVQSGNDACIVLAEGLAGTEENFASLMTARAREIGLTKSVFRNATGLDDPQQKVTARDLAVLTDFMIKTYPEHYPMFAQKEFTWNKIRQLNRNPLLAMDIGADGVKTGNLPDSGYGLIGSAVQNGQRLIVVVSGLKTANERANEARKLLDWGFHAFESRTLFQEGVAIGRASVYGGDPSGVDLVAKRAVTILVPRGSQERINARIIYRGPLLPPVAKGTEVGKLRITRGNVQALELPLYAAEDAAVGPVSRRAFDAVTELGLGWIRQAIGGKLLGNKI